MFFIPVIEEPSDKITKPHHQCPHCKTVFAFAGNRYTEKDLVSTFREAIERFFRLFFKHTSTYRERTRKRKQEKDIEKELKKMKRKVKKEKRQGDRFN